MTVSTLTRPQLIALAIQFNVCSSVSEAAAKSTQVLAEELEKNDECVNLVSGLGR